MDQVLVKSLRQVAILPPGESGWWWKVLQQTFFFFFLPSFHFLLSLQVVSGFADLSLEQHWKKGNKQFTLLCLHNSRGIDGSVYDTGTILVPWNFLGVALPPRGYNRVSCRCYEQPGDVKSLHVSSVRKERWPEPQMSSGLPWGTSPWRPKSVWLCNNKKTPNQTKNEGTEFALSSSCRLTVWQKCEVPPCPCVGESVVCLAHTDISFKPVF